VAAGVAATLDKAAAAAGMTDGGGAKRK